MFVLGLVLNTIGIGLLCWLIFRLAVYALPFFVAVSAGMMAFHSGAGILAAPLVGVATGVVALTAGRTALAMTRSPILRATIAAAFAIPATIAGYHVLLTMSQLGMPSPAGREVFACLGAAFIGGTAWTKLTAFVDPRRWSRAGSCSVRLRPFFRPQHATDSPSPSGSSTKFA